MKATLPDLLERAIRNRLAEVHTSMPGVIVTYDHAAKRASVRPSVNRRYIDGQVDEWPIINDVPVLLQGTPDGALEFPIAAGCPCAIFFAERSIDLWRQQGGQVTPDDPRRFSVSDAFCVPGLSAFTGGNYPPDNVKARFRYAGGALAIDDQGRVALGQMGGEELLALIDELLQALIDARTATQLGLQPLTQVPAFTDIKARLGQIKGSL